MEHKGYGVFFESLMKYTPDGEVILTTQVAKQMSEQFEMSLDQAKKTANVYLKRLADKKELVRLHKGIYYRVGQAVMKTEAVPLKTVMSKILIQCDEDIIGYEAGDSFYYKLGLEEEMPVFTEISTNLYRKKLDEKWNIVLQKPVTEINNRNYKYLQLIDGIKNMTDLVIEIEDSRKILLEWMQKENMDKEHLISYARRYYSQDTLLRVIDTIFMAEENNS